MDLRRVLFALAGLHCLMIGVDRVAAQSPRQNVVVDSIGAVALARTLAAPHAPWAGRPGIFTPTIISSKWEPDASANSVPPRFRDSSESVCLSRTLNASAARPSDVIACTDKASIPCRLSTEVLTVAFAEPQFVGDTATLVARLGERKELGNARLFAGAGVSLYVMRLVRTNDAWKVRCLIWAPPAMIERTDPDYSAICRSGRQ